MKEILKGSLEYNTAKQNAANVIFYCAANGGYSEHGSIYAEAWDMFSAKLYINNNCYVLKLGSACFFRWSARYENN